MATAEAANFALNIAIYTRCTRPVVPAGRLTPSLVLPFFAGEMGNKLPAPLIRASARMILVTCLPIC